MRIVTRAFLRYLPRHRGLSLLKLAGIACGVAAVVGMVLSAESALRSFSGAVSFLGGRATHMLERPTGPMPDEEVVALARDPSVRAFSPVLDRRLRLSSGDLVRLLGVDVFLDRGIRPEITGRRRAGARGNGLGETFLLDPAAVMADAGLAAELGLSPGSLLETTAGDFTLVGTFPNPSGEPLVVMDIAHAQELFNQRGLVDRVDLVLKNEEDFRARWGKGYVIQSGRQRAETMAAMLSAFRLNLEALSLLALFVGVFLIYNTAMFSVVSRRRDAAVLRSLGAARHEIAAAFLTEILMLGGAGGALGSALGYLLGRFLTGLLGGTISSLYFFLRPSPLPWSWWFALAGAGLGCGAGILGAAYPLLDLVRTDPGAALHGRVGERRAGRRAGATALAGAGVAGASLLLLAAPLKHVYVGFASAFGFLIGTSLTSGAVILVCAPLLGRVLGGLGGLPGKLAAGFVKGNLSRTAVAVAAFMVALSMSIGLGVMIGSFRDSLLWWMDTQLGGEVYIGNSPEVNVPEDFYEELKAIPGVGGVDVYRNVPLLYRGNSVRLAAIDGEVLQRYAEFAWVEGSDESWDEVRRGAVIVSESFSRRFDVRAGQLVELEGASGPGRFKVAGVFYDYTTEHGLIMMHRPVYLGFFGDRGIGTVALFFDEGETRKEAILDDVRQRAAGRGLPVFSKERFRTGILDVFDATFAVTRSMRALAIVVALFGIAGALLTLFMERQREFGVYRALGFSNHQVAVMTVMEGLGLGTVSLVMAAVAGTGLAAILIKVINLRSFNWTIFWHPSWKPYLLAGVTALAASLLASAWPAWKIYRSYPRMQLREE